MEGSKTGAHTSADPSGICLSLLLEKRGVKKNGHLSARGEKPVTNLRQRPVRQTQVKDPNV